MSLLLLPPNNKHNNKTHPIPGEGNTTPPATTTKHPTTHLTQKMSVVSELMQETATLADTPAVIPFAFQNVPEGKNPGEAISIKPITVGTWFRMRPLLAAIDKADVERLIARPKPEGDAPEDDRPTTDGTPSADALVIMQRYGELVFEIVCLGIHNRPGDMPRWFRETLQESATWRDLYVLLNAILYRLGVQSFSNSITVLKAVSPLGEEEMIALQRNKTAWTQKALSASSQPPTRPSDTATERPSPRPMP